VKYSCVEREPYFYAAHQKKVLVRRYLEVSINKPSRMGEAWVTPKSY
jgi:hypothetical protein